MAHQCAISWFFFCLKYLLTFFFFYKSLVRRRFCSLTTGSTICVLTLSLPSYIQYCYSQISGCNSLTYLHSFYNYCLHLAIKDYMINISFLGRLAFLELTVATCFPLCLVFSDILLTYSQFLHSL